MSTQISVLRKKKAAHADFETFAKGLPGVVKCTQVFPGDEDKKLERIYVVYADPAKAAEVIAALQSSPLVKEAERCAVRTAKKSKTQPKRSAQKSED